MKKVLAIILCIAMVAAIALTVAVAETVVPDLVPAKKALAQATLRPLSPLL